MKLLSKNRYVIHRVIIIKIGMGEVNMFLMKILMEPAPERPSEKKKKHIILTLLFFRKKIWKNVKAK